MQQNYQDNVYKPASNASPPLKKSRQFYINDISDDPSIRLYIFY